MYHKVSKTKIFNLHYKLIYKLNKKKKTFKGFTIQFKKNTIHKVFKNIKEILTFKLMIFI